MPMGPRMQPSPFHVLRELARSSWRRQLALLGISAVVLGAVAYPVLSGAMMVAPIALGAVLALALVSYASGKDAELVPRLAAQVAFAGVPMLAGAGCFLAASAIHPLLGFIVVPVMFAALAISAPLALLAIGAVLAGDRDWLPRHALASWRPRWWQLGLLTAAGTIAALFISLPVLLAGFMLDAVLGPLGFVGSGLAIAVVVPWTSMAAQLAWRAAGSAEFEHVDAVATGAPQPAWQLGPHFDAVLEATGTWGTWLQVSEPTLLALQLDWSGLAGPHMQLATQAGVAVACGQPLSTGGSVQVALDPGATWLQLTSSSFEQQHVRVQVLLPPAGAVAA
ncbi:MAG: hypothetical protein JWM25_453 [Thermoleophilia bacterium]|nr:hypothetical protein [Thermoleophilia bacterium]